MSATHLVREHPDPSLDGTAGGGELGADVRQEDCAPTPVQLPLAIEATPPAEVEGQGEQAVQPVRENRLRILVVDDNVDAAESIAEVLALLGSQVRVAHDAIEALRLARESVPDLALLDIGLPGIDGYELARRLRSEHPSVRLVAVSGYGQDADRAAALQAGFSRHLVKPLSLEEIECLVIGDPASAPEEARSWGRRS